MNPKILIIGHGRHGKDTAADILNRKYDYSFTSSSLACAEILKPVLDIVNGTKTADDHFAERHQNRELWKELISIYTASDPAALAKAIVAKTDIYVGMRAQREFEASEHLFETIFYVDAWPRVTYTDPTFEIAFDSSRMVLIDNSGDMDYLEAQL